MRIYSTATAKQEMYERHAPRRGITWGTRLRIDMKVFSRTMAAI